MILGSGAFDYLPLLGPQNTDKLKKLLFLPCFIPSTLNLSVLFSPDLEDTATGQRSYHRDAPEPVPSYQTGPREHPDKADVYIMYATVEGERIKVN